MNFIAFCIPYIISMACHSQLLEINGMKNLVGKFSQDDQIVPRVLQSDKNILQSRRHNLFNSAKNIQPTLVNKMSDEERKERMDEAMARIMQILTFFGHIDNFITHKTNGFLKIMRSAMESSEDETEEQYFPKEYYKLERRFSGRNSINATS